MTTFADLLTPPTATEEEAVLLSSLRSAGFPVAEWDPGGRGMARAIATSVARHGEAVPGLASGGVASLAQGLWLDLLAGNYRLVRAPATSTRQRCELRCDVGLGPHTVTAGFVARAKSGLRYMYRGEADVEVPDGAGQAPGVPAVVIELEAEQPGALYSDPAGTITEIVTELPGLAISNPPRPLDFVPARKEGPGFGVVRPVLSPADLLLPETRKYLVTILEGGSAGQDGKVQISYFVGQAERPVVTLSPIPLAADLGEGVSVRFDNVGVGSNFTGGAAYVFNVRTTPILRQGTDEESDQSLAARCRGRWPALGLNPTDGAFENFVRTVSIEKGLGIQRLLIAASDAVAGQVAITVATASGDPGPEVIAVLQTALATTYPRDQAFVRGARNREIVATGSVAVPALDFESVKRTASSSWSAYLASLPIGGDRQLGGSGVVRLSELAKALMDAGAVDVQGLQLNGGASNLLLAGDEAAIPEAALADTLTWLPV